MKFAFTSLLVLASLNSFAASVSSKPASIKVSRVEKVITLVDKADIKVKIVVEELGLSTDVSPTKNVYLTLYVPGEMSDAEATFDLGQSYGVDSAKRNSAGIYEIVGSSVNPADRMPVKSVITVDAAKSIVAIKALECPELESCNFEGSVEMKVKTIK